MKIIVKENNVKLYEYLRKNLSNKSKNNIKSLLKNGCIIVNNKLVIKYDYLLKKDDIIKINKKENFNNFTLDIIYEDDDIIVIDKPCKILTISTKKEKEETLYRKVSDYLKKEKKKVFIVHRLDYDTSGIIVFAKNKKVQEIYQKDWNNLAILREYTAVVEGITKNSGHIKSYLKQTKTLEVYSSNKKDGLLAITDYQKITNNDKYTLLKIHISTGRRNQIRCHMHDINHPILGDIKYNPTDKRKRLMLHANKLILKNPITNKVIEFNSNIPEEFITLTSK